MVGRIPVMDVTPVVNLGRNPAKATVGERFDVTALVFREGHDQLGAEVVLTDPTGVRRAPLRMVDVPDEVSRMRATVRPDTEGPWTFEVQAWGDPLGTWLHDGPIKIRAGVDVGGLGAAPGGTGSRGDGESSGEAAQEGASAGAGHAPFAGSYTVPHGRPLP